MITVLILACYLPLALIPAALPFSAIRHLRQSFPVLALVPVASSAIALALAQPLTGALGYAVALVPLVITFASLAIGILGIRFAIEARRAHFPIARLLVLTLLAMAPFLLILPFLVSASVTMLARFAGA